MCWSCVEETGGDKVVLTDEHKLVCNLIWEWYQAPDLDEGGQRINGCGGALHVQLDDFNLEDELLTDNWWRAYDASGHQTLDVPLWHYTPETFARGQRIIEALRALTEAERNAVAYHAESYGAAPPYPHLFDGKGSAK